MMKTATCRKRISVVLIEDMHSLILKQFDLIKNTEKILYVKDGRWLHPLLACLDEISKSKWEPSSLILDDKVIGRAAALLIVYAGITKAHGRLMSRKAVEVFEKYSVDYSYDTLVDRIECQTEDLFLVDSIPYEVFCDISRRAQK